jgi:hypothetical protein
LGHNDDAEYGAWMQSRWGLAQTAWAADLARVTGAKGDGPSPAEIIAAAEAWHPGVILDAASADILTKAVMNRQGPFALFVERETAAARLAGVDVNERVAPHREAMRAMFRKEVGELVREARG